MKSRAGYTLVEVMIATFITVVLATALATLFTGVYRLIRQSYCVASDSLALRAEREHMLFHSEHEGGDAFWGGLLSAWKLESLQDRRVQYTSAGLSVGQVRPRHDRNGKAYPSKPFLVRSATFGYADETTARTNLVLVTLSQTVERVSRSQRVAVPRFGTEQVWDGKNVFYDAREAISE